MALRKPLRSCSMISDSMSRPLQSPVERNFIEYMGMARLRARAWMLEVVWRY